LSLDFFSLLVNEDILVICVLAISYPLVRIRETCSIRFLPCSYISLLTVFMDYAAEACTSFRILFPSSYWSSSYSLLCRFIIPCYVQLPVFTHSVYMNFLFIPVFSNVF
jgi:hypothetical protein